MSTPSPAAERLVWLPFDVADLDAAFAAQGDDGPPAGLRFETVDPTALETLPASVADVALYVPPYRMDPVIAEPLPAMTSLQAVQLLSAGADHVRGRVPAGVDLCTGRGIHDSSTAELALTLVLASLRGVPGFVRAQDRGAWEPQWRPALADRRVLLVGAGAIGSAIEARLAPFEVEVVRVARTARDDERGHVHGVEELPALVPHADVVVLILPLTERSRGLVDAELLAAMRPGALLVNLARGPVVDTDALVAALHEGRISAAIDVVDPEPLPPEHPLWRAPNLLVSPHVGGASSAMWPRAHRLVAAQLRRFAAGEPLANRVAGDS